MESEKMETKKCPNDCAPKKNTIFASVLSHQLLK